VLVVSSFAEWSGCTGSTRSTRWIVPSCSSCVRRARRIESIV